ncbi:MAG: T9SS type A sorting domain-containing protein, partial [candidate division Zixibacteria bacterium]
AIIFRGTTWQGTDRMIITNSIVANNGGFGIQCNHNTPVEQIDIECCDFFANGRGVVDTNSCAAEATMDNVISNDPQFCDTAQDDYTLQWHSPCNRYNSDCGRMGALPLACGELVRYEELLSVAISPVAPALMADDTGTFSVLGRFDDLSVGDVTAWGRWRVSDTIIATVNTSTGLVSGLSTGTCELMTRIGDYYDTVALSIVPGVYPVENDTLSPTGASCSLKVAISGNPDTAQLLYRVGAASAEDTIGLVRLFDSLFVGVFTVPSQGLRGIEYAFRAIESGLETRMPSDDSLAGWLSLRLQLVDEVTPDIPDGVFSMIGFPLEVSPSDFDNVFSDGFSQPAGDAWRVGWWDPSSEAYLKNSAVGAIVQGRGYWIWSTELANVDVDGLSAVPDTIVGGQRYKIILLEPGWNQMSNPFAFTVDWESRIRDGGVGRWPFEYVSGNGASTTYDTARHLNPFVGYWINNESLSAKRVLLPFVEADESLATSGRANSSGPGWEIQLLVNSGRAADQVNIIGAHERALDGADPLDFNDPPPPPGKYVALTFLRENSEGGIDRLGGDYRSLMPRGWVFDCQLTGNTELPATVLVLHTEPPSLDLHTYLIEPTNRTAYEVTSEKPLLFPHLPSIVGTSYKIVVGEKSLLKDMHVSLSELPRDFELGQNYPNPFNGTTVISLSIPYPAEVKLYLYNVLGQEVRQLLNGWMPAGHHLVDWDGLDRDGKTVASGVYFYRFRSGEYVVSKKMVLLK